VGKKTKALYKEERVFFIKKEKRSVACHIDLKQAVKVLFIREKIPVEKKTKALHREDKVFF